MTIQERLIELLMDAEELREQGRAVTAEELCPESAELWPALRDLLHGLGQVDRMLPPAAAGVDTTEPVCAAAATCTAEAGLPEIPGYEIRREIGRGGMGVVYEAYQQSLGRHVALKFLPNRGDLARFRREARAAGRLHHTNIVPVFGIGDHHGRHFYAMQYISGRGLDAVLEERVRHRNGNASPSPVPPDFREVARIGAQVAEALAYANAQGVTHRDIKPSNLLLDERGTVWIADFGLAKDTADAATLTATGDVLGTLRYLAPERLSGRADARADIYGLGASLYELICSQPAFANADRAVLLHQLLHREPPRPRSIEPRVPRDLETIVLKAMARDPDQRYATAAALADDCRRFLEDRPIRAQGQRCRAAGAVVPAQPGGGVLAVGGLPVTGDDGWAGHPWVLAGIELAPVAERQRAIAGAAERKARDEATTSSRLFYITSMNVAREDWDTGNLRHLREMLAETRDHPDRGFEWAYWRRMTHRDALVLRGHAGAVYSVAFARDGQKLATGSADGTAKIWDAATGRERLTLSGHGGGVRALAFAPDSKSLVSAGADGAVRAWDADSGKPIRAYTGHAGPVNAVAFLPDGSRIVTAGDDHIVRALDFGSGRLLFTISDHQGAVRALAVSPDGKYLASGGDDRRVRIWDAARGRPLNTSAGGRQVHQNTVTCLDFSPDSGYVVSGGLDRELKHAFALGEVFEIYKGHAWDVTSVAYSPTHGRIVSGSADRTLQLWGGKSDLETIKGHTGAVLSVAFSHDGRRVISGSADRTARVWDIAGPRPIVFKGSPYSFNAVAFSPDGRHVASGSRGGTVTLRDAASGGEVLTIPAHSGAVHAVAFAPGGQSLATASDDGTARAWNADTGRPIRAYIGHAGPVMSVAYSPEGARLVTASDDGTARVWDAYSGQTILTLGGHRDQVFGAVFAPNGRRILTGGADWTVRAWDAATGREVLTLRGHTAGVTAVAFSPDSTRIITASWDRSVRVWDAATGLELNKLHAHREWVSSITFSPDGQRFLTTGRDEEAKLFDTAAGRELLSLKHPAYWVAMASAFSSDGRRILTGLHDTGVIWEAATDEQVAAWEHDDRAADESLAAAIRERADTAREKGFLQDWLVVAPIQLPLGQAGAEALNREQVQGEALLRPHAGDRIAVGAQDLVWRPHRLTDYFVDFNEIVGARTAFGVAYAVCYLQSDAEQTGLRLGVGSDDQAKVYLNGKQVYASSAVRALGREPDATAAQDLTLHKGMNVLVLKVVNETLDWRGSVRLVDRDGRQIRGVQVLAAP